MPVPTPALTCRDTVALLASAWLLATPATAGAQSGAAAPRAELRVQQLRPGLNVVYGAGGNVLVWGGPDGVVLVDTGPASQAPELFETVARVAPGVVRFVVDTHGHADHTGGNAIAARRGAVIVGHERLRDLPADATAATAGESGTPAADARPQITTGDALALHLNGDRVDVLHVANGHTAADLVVRWGQADVVALGDLYWNGLYPYIDLAAGGSLAGIVAAVEAVLARSNAHTIVVPGHGPVSGRAELAAYRDMLVTVGRRVREAVERGEGLEQIQASHPTAAYDARNARPGAVVSPAEFVRLVYADLTRP